VGGRAGGDGSIRISASAVIDLPQPDSPTRAVVLPRCRSKVSPSTTVYSLFLRRSRTVRSCTESVVLFSLFMVLYVYLLYLCFLRIDCIYFLLYCIKVVQYTNEKNNNDGVREMKALLSLFAHSPFAPLQRHMDQVTECIKKVEEIFEVFFQGDIEKIEKIAGEIRILEHEADVLKNEIRNHLPRGLFLPVARGDLLDILSFQDSIADKAEDIGVLLGMRRVDLPEGFEEKLRVFISKNLEAFYGAKDIINELNRLLHYSFSGVEAEKVREMIMFVAKSEDDADVLQRGLLKTLYNTEGEVDVRAFHLVLRITAAIGAVADLSEKLANRVRMMLDLS